MKILVLSDSHSGLSFMRYAIRAVRPNAVIHLGDYYDDAEVLAQENLNLPFHMVGGNCDRYRSYEIRREMLCYDVCGVKLMMTHGHNQHVKSSLYSLLCDGRRENVQAVLYGHTHCPNCHQEPDGMWVLNPGACGSFGGSVGLIETENRSITDCRILRQPDMEAML